jgi:hypothetical protein
MGAVSLNKTSQNTLRSCNYDAHYYYYYYYYYHHHHHHHHRRRRRCYCCIKSLRIGRHKRNIKVVWEKP